MTNLAYNQSDSPFDAIRHYDEYGDEFWSARELMPMLGYQKWERFNNVIGSAQENLETLTHVP